MAKCLKALSHKVALPFCLSEKILEIEGFGMSKNFSYKKEKSPVEFGDSGASFGAVFNCDVPSQEQFNCILKSSHCQEVASKKILSELVADSFNRLGKKYNDVDDDESDIRHHIGDMYLGRSVRIRSCSTFLQFQFDLLDGQLVGDPRLYKANFCRDRLCPQCEKRKSLKNYANLSQVLSEVSSDYSLLLLTLTVPNVSGESLSAAIDRLMYSFNKFTKFKRFSSVVKGYFRALEITVNKNTGLFHPHFHCVLVVDSGYFKSRQYIPHSEWLEMWRQATNDYSITQVNIKRFRGSNCSESDREILKKSINEVSHYTVKDSDFISDDISVMDRNIEILANALKGRRLVHFGGLLRDIFRKLKLEDAESNSADLTDMSGAVDNMSGDVVHLLVTLKWSAGCYKFIDSQQIG